MLSHPMGHYPVPAALSAFILILNHSFSCLHSMPCHSRSLLAGIFSPVIKGSLLLDDLASAYA